MSNDLIDAFKHGTLIKKWQTDCDHLGDCVSNSGEEGIYYYRDKFYIIQFNNTWGMYGMDMQNPAQLDISELDDELREPCEKYLIFMDELQNGPRPRTCAACGAESSEEICSKCETREQEYKHIKCQFTDEASDQCIHKEENGDCTGWCAREYRTDDKPIPLEQLFLLNVDIGNCVMKNEEKNYILLKIKALLEERGMKLKGFSVIP